MVIETKRMILRPFNTEDLGLIQSLYCDEEMLKYTPFDKMSRDQAARHLDRIIRTWGQPPEYNHEMAVVLKGSNERIGRTHIEIDRDTDTGMIGWFLLPEHWGQGYAAEMTEALIDYCFDVFGLHRVNAVCNPENTASWHVLEKCGMTREAYLRKKCRYEKQGVVSWEDELEYAILASERRIRKMEKLSEYHNTIVRILCGDGTVVTGPCEWYPSGYGLAEFGVEEELLQIGDTVVFADEIREIEMLRREVCIPVRDWPEAKEEIAAWFHERWSIPLETYRESIRACLGEENGLPQWYVVVRGSRIIAGCGVIANDFHERKDLTPNVCAVYVDEAYRRQGIAGFMLRYVCEDMAAMGFPTLYLLTDLIGFYERYGWRFACMALGDDGRISRMYVHRA